MAVPAAEKLGNQIEAIILKRIESDRLSVPAMPEVAARCLAATRDPDFSLRRSVDILEQDPVLAARIIHLASSAAYSGGSRVGTLLDAVTRLGMGKLKNILVESSARQVFQSKDRRIVEATRGLWEHSVAVAIIARDLVAFGSHSDTADAAYLAGLLHDVGKPVVAAMLLEAERMLGKEAGGNLVDHESWVGIISRTHRKVGVALAKKWSLPADVAAAIEDCSEYDNSERGAACNYVRFANAVAKQEGLYVGEVDDDDVGALIMIGRSLLSVDDEILSSLTDNLRERVQDQASD